MDLVYSDDEDFTPKESRQLTKTTNRKSLFSFFFDEFQKKDLIKNGIDLIFMYFLAKYVMTEESNPVMFVGLGVFYISAQNALKRYIITRNLF